MTWFDELPLKKRAICFTGESLVNNLRMLLLSKDLDLQIRMISNKIVYSICHQNDEELLTQKGIIVKLYGSKQISDEVLNRKLKTLIDLIESWEKHDI